MYKNLENTRIQNKKLFNKNFVLLWQGQFVSQIGTQISAITLIFLIKDLTNHASLMGLSIMIFSLAVVLSTPIGGTIADFYSKKLIFIFSDLAGGIISFTLSFIIFKFFKYKSLIIFFIFLAQSVYGLNSAFFNTAMFASIPLIVNKKDLTKANSFKNASQQIAILIGQGIGGVLFKLLGAAFIFFFNGFTYFISALSECFIEIPNIRDKTHNKSNNSSLKTFFKNTKEGLKYLWNEKGIRKLAILFGVYNFFLPAFIILLPFYVEKYLKTGPEWYGFLMGGFSGGAFMGYVFISMLSISGVSRSKLIVFLLFIFSSISGTYGFIYNKYIALLYYILGGFILGAFTIVFDTSTQIMVPENLRGRVSGAIGVISQGLMPMGMVLAGIVADVTNKNIPMIYLVCGLFLFVATLYTFVSEEPKKVLACENII